MTNSREDALELDPAPSKAIPKPWVFPVPKGTLQRIFGSSQVFQNLDDVKPKVDFYALRAEAYIQLCDFSSAAQNLRRAYSFQPENTKYLERLTLVLYLQGQCLFEQRAFPEALRVFSQASALQPEKASFRYRCMACLLALEQHQDCLSLVTKEVKLGTTNADVFILRARLYNFFRKPSLCHRDLHSALLLDAKHPQAKVLLQMMVDQAQKARQDAGILAVQGKLQHALQHINCAIENNPLDPSLFLFRGTMYRRLQEFDAAVEDLLKALDMMSESQEGMVRQAQRQLLLTYNDFAVHCYLQGAYQEGVLLLNKALKDEQQEKGLYINRGDCFFQLGNLTFAEADYQQALALSPQDEGANLRMGLLQERMGFCEQRSRQFHKADSHFSMAIQHNPQKAQYYLHRARSRQLLQNILGARLDVATVLLLSPKQPKVLPLMASLFPGMSVEEVLCSQVAHLARLQLNRVLESSLQAGIPRGIVGQLRQREQERQKARALQFWWKPLLGTSEELQATPQTLTGEPAIVNEAEALHEEEEEEQWEPAPSRMRSLSNSYLDQTSSGSVFGFRTMSISETETSTICQEYKSTSATAVTSSNSSLLKTLSSDLLENREDLSLSHSPSKTKATQGHSQSPSRTKATQGQSRRPSRTKATQGHSWRPSKMEAAQSQSPSRTKATQGHSQRPSKMEADEGQSQSPSRTKATQGQSRRPSKMEDAQGQSQSPSRTKATQGQCRRPSKTEATQGQSQSPSRTKATQGQSQSPSRTKATQGQSQSPSRTEATQGQSRRPSKMEATQGQSQSPSRTKATQGQSQSPSRTKATQGQSQSPSRTKITQGQSQKPSKEEAAQDQSRRPSRTKAAQGQSWSSSRMEATHSQCRRPSKMEAAQGQSQSSSQTEATQGQSWRPSQTEATQGTRQKPNKAKATQGPRKRLRKIKAAHGRSWGPSKAATHGRSGGLIRSSSKTKDFYDSSWSPSNTEATQDQCQRSSKTTAAQSWSQNTSPGSSKTEVT
ncbi:tetratricopeptide repeat protein 16 isoform X2 [Zalophus californianus]|uniref:Tetratricopeptide repeat protein 16 isoform X2 n=1 Tax=Zalophus californianus TaxID=9704 RepID=A0A6P9FFE6_ZALCA|nr:tetratricopeptide repeat protein 16 isoform X2 [Zalophus californianus]